MNIVFLVAAAQNQGAAIAIDLQPMAPALATDGTNGHLAGHSLAAIMAQFQVQQAGVIGGDGFEAAGGGIGTLGNGGAEVGLEPLHWAK